MKYESRVIKSNPVRILKPSRHDFWGKNLCDGYCMDIMWCLCVEVKIQWRVIWFCKAFLRTSHVSLFECKGPWMLKTGSLKLTDSLELVSAIFFIIFLFLPQMIVLQKPWKMFFISSKKLHFFLEIFTFLYFFHLLSTLFRLKTTNGSRIIYDAMNWLA